MPELPQIQTLVNALGWTLIHFLWQGLFIAGLFWAVCRWTRPEQASIRYWTGMLAFLAAIVIPGATFLLYLPGTPEAVVTGPATAGVVTLGAALKPSFSQMAQMGLEPVLPVVVALWGLGVALLSSRAMLGWLGARRLVTQGTREVGPGLRAVVDALMQKIGVRQAVRVLSSTRVKVPTVIGWIKPVILLPVSVIAKLPRTQLEMIIAHELGHIRRHDYLLNLMQVLIETLFFYHPAIRWMSRQVRQEREHCCDDLVVARCAQPVVYARALASLESLRSPLANVVMAASGGDLVHRVRRIVRRELPRNHAGFTQLTLLLGIALAVSLSARQGLDLSRQTRDAEPLSATLTGDSQRLNLQDRTAWLVGLQTYPGLSVTVREVRAAEDERRAALEQERQARAQLERQQAAAEAARRAVEAQRQAGLEDPMGVSRDAQVSRAGGSSIPAHDRLAERMIAANAPIAGLRDSDPGERARRERREAIDEVTVTPETVVAPIYPFKARRQKLEGHVRLEFSVDATGRARDISVVDASPPDIFEESAVRALEKWVFEVDDSHSRSARVYQDFDFNMEDNEPVLGKRERRCDITGSRICGLNRWNK